MTELCWEDQLIMVGGAMQERRQSLGVSLRSFAKSTGLSASFVALVESGKCCPGKASAAKILDALGLPIEVRREYVRCWSAKELESLREWDLVAEGLTNG